jgi:hypothetical protein
MSNLSNPALDAATVEFNLGNPVPLRAYYGLVPGKTWGTCFACEEPGWISPSGLIGKWTCEKCEADIALNLGGVV